MVSLVAFVISLIGIKALFIVKAIEVRRNTQLLPLWRACADSYALSLKQQVRDWNDALHLISPFVVHIMHFVMHEIALGVAAIARITERSAHSLAERISHKHTFKNKQTPITRSEFLRKVTEHKNENNSQNNTNPL